MNPIWNLSERLYEILAVTAVGARQAARDFWQTFCRFDRRLEVAFYRFIVLVMLFSAPLIGLIAALFGGATIGLIGAFLWLKHAVLKCFRSFRKGGVRG